jgi:CRISPR-associated protein Cst2
MKNATCLTLTFLGGSELSSLNGSEKVIDNVSSIKVIAKGLDQIPYGSPQMVRHFVREGLKTGEKSPIMLPSEAKGAATTGCDVIKYIDDDLFGFMDAKSDENGGIKKRTGPFRASPLIAVEPRNRKNEDFGTNFTAVTIGGDPSIHQTEFHTGTNLPLALYRATFLLELDRVGVHTTTETEVTEKAAKGKKAKVNRKMVKIEIPNATKAERVCDLLDSIRNLWIQARQGRFLCNVSPRLVIAAISTVKTPFYLGNVQITDEGKLNVEIINEVNQDHKNEILASTIGYRTGTLSETPEGVVAIGEAFDAMKSWINQHYL